MIVIARAVAAFLGLVLLLTSGAPALAQSATSTITGQVIDRRNALPVTGATVSVTQAGKPVSKTTTDTAGRYTITGIPGAVYDITVSARGYGPTLNSGVALTSGATVTMNASLEIATTSAAGALRTIGHSSTSSPVSNLASATTITQSINVQDLTNTGQLRVGNALGNLPGVNFRTSSSPGDDASINLRGFGPTETATLLDGHPIGPLGVNPNPNNATSFNYALGPAYGLQRVDVTYGSGAQGLYGNDTIGGAVNLLTLSPTAKQQFSFQQQVGGFGLRSTGITATGTTGKLGYAIAAARLGQTGVFSGGLIPQTGRPNNVVSGSVNPNSQCDQYANDVSRCNLALNTYAVSQNTLQSLGLVKLQYALSGASNLSFTAYDAAQRSDSTGNGDNDYMPYSVRLGQIQSGPANCSTRSGSPGYTVITNPIPTTPTTGCYTAQEYASATSGPYGGGAGRQRGTHMADYHMRFTTRAGVHNITVDGFVNNYAYYNQNGLSGGIDANGGMLGVRAFQQNYNTKGFLVSDEISNDRNDFAYGYELWHQSQYWPENDANMVPTWNNYPPVYFGEWSGFIRDSYQISNQLSTFVNAWLKHSSVTNRSTFDPRATLQYRPSHSDIVQFTYGRSDGAPSPYLKVIGSPYVGSSNTITQVQCNTINSVADSGNPNLQSEAANDFEFGYGHRFKDDSNIQVNAYVTTIANQLFYAAIPVSQFGAQNLTFAPGVLQAYYNKFSQQCPSGGLTPQSMLDLLGVTTTYNAARALSRGVDLSGRARLNRIAYIDYSYDIASTTQSGISNAILHANPTVIDGAQVYGIPLHQASLSLDVAPGPWEFRIDNYYMEQNNQYNRPSFWHSDAFVSRTFNKGRTTMTLGGTNIFNNAVQDYGYIGLGTVPASNAVSGVTMSPMEEYGLLPAQLTLTLSQKVW